MPGTLFVVGTPIGNLEDLTFRALRTLREVDFIAAEDTRRTSRLLARYEVRKPLVSLREHNEARETPRLLDRLKHGESAALVSDAGTPGISDPGGRLVRAAREAGLPVVPVPGPSAVTAALSCSGVDADQFVFLGFPPSSGRAREEWFAQVAAETRTVVFFESPHRIERTISELAEVKQPIYIHRELSKINESFVVYQNDHQRPAVTAKGEFTIVVPSSDKKPLSIDEEGIFQLFSQLVAGTAMDHAKAVHLAAIAHGVPDQVARKAVKRLKILAKQPIEAPP